MAILWENSNYLYMSPKVSDKIKLVVFTLYFLGSMLEGTICLVELDGVFNVKVLFVHHGDNYTCALLTHIWKSHTNPFSMIIAIIYG